MRMWDKSIDELEITVRCYSCLKNAHIRTVGELVRKTESELLQSKKLGRKSLDELKEVLAGFGLRFVMSEDDEGGAAPVRRPNKPLQPVSGARGAQR